jgi:hypothetical protein
MTNFKRYLRIQLLMFVYGIVGPMFLVGYFAGSDPTAKWLYWWGLLITAADVLIALAVTANDAKNQRLAAQRQRPLTTPTNGA